MPPAVSVIIPTRDRWELVARAIDSVLRQEGVSLEVIVVDDGSSERPPGIEQLESPSVSVIRHETSRGPPAARNAGIARARSGWLAFLDDDDLWAPHKLVSMLDRLDGSGAEFCYSAVVNVDDRLRVIGYEAAPSPDALIPSLFKGNMIPGGGSNVIAHSALLERTGGFDESIPMLDDWDLWIRFALSAEGAASDEPLTAYCRHPQSWSSSADREVPATMRRFVAKHAPTAEVYGVESDFMASPRTVAYRHVLAGRRAQAAKRYLASAIRERDPRDLVRAGGAMIGNRGLGRLGLRNMTPPDWLEAHVRR